MLGQNHQQTTIGIASLITTFYYHAGHSPIHVVFNHLDKGIGNLTYVHFWTIVCFIVGNTITSTWPDMDSHNSKLAKTLPQFWVKRLRHHGTCHSLFGFLIFAISLSICFTIFHIKLLNGLYYGMVFGYFAHLLEDSFSQGGIIWLYPLMPYDQKMWQKYHVILRPVKYFDSRSRPIRHWWGRGYKVGSKSEYKFAKTICIAGLTLLIWTII